MYVGVDVLCRQFLLSWDVSLVYRKIDRQIDRSVSVCVCLCVCVRESVTSEPSMYVPNKLC